MTPGSYSSCGYFPIKQDTPKGYCENGMPNATDTKIHEKMCALKEEALSHDDRNSDISHKVVVEYKFAEKPMDDNDKISVRNQRALNVLGCLAACSVQ